MAGGDVAIDAGGCWESNELALCLLLASMKVVSPACKFRRTFPYGMILFEEHAEDCQTAQLQRGVFPPLFPGCFPS